MRAEPLRLVLQLGLLLGFTLLPILLTHRSVEAQELTGSLEGWVVDPEGRPLGDAQVTVTGSALLGPRIGVSRADGYFKVPLVPVGEVDVVLQHPDYQQVRMEGVTIALGKTVSLGRTRLSPEGALVEVMVVHGRALLDEGSTEIGSNLTQEDLQDLPTQRDYREVLAYLPQVDGVPLPPAVALPGGGINIAGSSGTENSYVVDGINVTDGFFGDTGIQLPPDFIREIELKIGGYQAEYGRSTGGIVNVLTKSGTDTFESQVFGFFTNNDFAGDRARSFLELEQQEFSRYDVGVGLGGPMVPQKLNYYLAYNPSVATEDLVLPGGSAHQDKVVTHRFAAKLNWRAGANTDVTVSGFGDPTTWDRVGISHVAPVPVASLANPDPLLGKWDTGGLALVLSAQHRLGDRVFLQADLSRVESSKKAVPATARGAEEVRFNDWSTGDVDGGYGYTFDHRSLRYASRLKGTVYVGSHEVKAGLEYEDNLLDDEWYFKTASGEPGILATFDGNLFFETLMDIDQEMRHRIPSAFLQDSWRVDDRLRLYAGLRWDGLYIINPDGQTAGRILDQYQPRAGISYTLGQDQRHKLFGSYGRFYEQMPTVSSFVLGKYRFDQRGLSCDPRTCEPDTVFLFHQGPDGTARVDDDIRGPHYDEFIVGYDHRPADQWTFGVRGIYRDLREAIDSVGGANWVNPGRGVASRFPRPKREYTALELTVSRQRDARWQWSASYVLSRLYGNYGGPGTGAFYPHWSTNFNEALSYTKNGEGLLDNDRTHVFKTYGSYSFDMGLTVGGFFTWQSGSPINEGGIVPPGTAVFLSPRGSYGRTPAIWDLNLRLSYDLIGLGSLGRTQPRLLLDVFHLFSEEEVTGVDMLRYTSVDPETLEGLAENENFGRAQAWQPPMTVRLGIETRF